jgi:hypothetical protein
LQAADLEIPSSRRSETGGFGLPTGTARETPEGGTDREADDEVDQRILRTEGSSGPQDGAV